MSGSETIDEFEDEKPRKFSPLFPDANDNGKRIYADEIGYVLLFRVMPGAKNPGRRIRVSKREYVIPNSDKLFVINPYVTTEDELEEQFGGGEYYLEPRTQKHERLPCGRDIILPGPMKPGIRQMYHQEMRAGTPNAWGNFEEEETRVDPREAMREVMREFREKSEDSPVALATQINESFAKRQEQSLAAVEGLVSALKNQIEDMRKTHQTEMASKNQEVSDMRRKFERDLDESREEWTAKRRLLEAEMQTMKMSNHREVDTERRLRTDVEDAVRKRFESRITELEKRISDLTSENFELQQELASVPQEGPSMTEANKDEPWWVGRMGQVLGPIAKVAAERAGQAPPGAPAIPAGMPTFVPQHVPQHVPPQPMAAVPTTMPAPPEPSPEPEHNEPQVPPRFAFGSSSFFPASNGQSPDDGGGWASG